MQLVARPVRTIKICRSFFTKPIIMTRPKKFLIHHGLWQSFNLFAAAENSANVCVAHGTLCNDTKVHVATTA